MIIIGDSPNEGINFAYPLLGYRYGRTIYMAPWTQYEKKLPFLIGISILLCGYGVALFNDDFYSDKYYDFFAFLVFVYSFIRNFFLVRPRLALSISRRTSIRLAPIGVAIEFGASFISLGISQLLFANHSKYSFATAIGFLGLAFIIFGLLPAMNAIAYKVGIGKSDQSA